MKKYGGIYIWAFHEAFRYLSKLYRLLLRGVEENVIYGLLGTWPHMARALTPEKRHRIHT